MRLLTVGLRDHAGPNVVDEADVLATFWRGVTHKLQRNYPELSGDDVYDQLSTLLLDVHAACQRSLGALDCATGASASSLVRAACSDVVARSSGDLPAALSGRHHQAPGERRADAARGRRDC